LRRCGGGSALDASEGEVENRPQHEFPGDREVPADSAGAHYAIPLHRDRGRSLAVTHSEGRIVTAVRQRTLQVEREVFTGIAAARDRGLAKIRVARPLGRERT